MKNLVMETDALYEKAVDVIRKTRRASLTHLQRRLGIGYQSAARLIDMLKSVVSLVRSVRQVREKFCLRHS